MKITFWITSALIAWLVYLYGDQIFLSVFTWYSVNDPYGFLSGAAAHIAPCANYIMPAGVAYVSYLLYSRISAPQCPNCEGEMVLRRAKRGIHAGEFFWGCCNYPHCTVTYSLSSASIWLK